MKQTYIKNILFFLFISISFIGYTQQTKKMKILNADITFSDDDNSEVIHSVGNVIVEINGATIRCKQVEMYPDKNYMKAIGDVVLNQGDTITQTSDYADYDGEKKLLKSWGNVVLKDPIMELTSEKIHFDREKQHLYYNTGGKIKDSVNVLTSRIGNYYLETKKFQAFNRVVVTNPDQVLKSENLDYFTESGKAYLNKASTITGKESVIYTEKGFHDSKAKISHLTKNSWIKYDDRLIVGDSLYHEGITNFSSATGNIKVTDTINDGILKGGYAEFFRAKDSAFIVDRAVAISLIDKDSLYIHGDTLLLTGKAENRIIRAFNNVKFFKLDLQGKCDSLQSNQNTGVTKMYRKPVLWSEGSQITGNTIEFLSNNETEQLDSLKVLKNAFMVQKDSLGYNQTKGKNLFGKFTDNNLEIVDILGNGEVVHYIRNAENELLGISKMRCSNINVILKDQKVQTIEFRINPDGKTYPEEEIHENDRLLKGFIWRENERPKNKEDIFFHDPMDIPIMKQERILEQEEKKVLRKETERKLKGKLKSSQIIQAQDSITPRSTIKDRTLKVKVEETVKQDSIIPPSKEIENPPMIKKALTTDEG
jgi:lipopolysaccharide export system protein LptA